MSFQAVEWALYRAPMLLTDKGKPDTTARQVLSVLAEHANESGRNAHPSVLRIRFATGLDDRTIERALLRLQASALIAMSGRARTGTRKWNLDLSAVRAEDEWDQMVAEADKIKTLESERRKARRHRSSCADSTPDPESVRDADSRTSGTQSTGVRDGTPPEPFLNHPPEPPFGGTLPPSPLRPPSPPAPGTYSHTSLAEPLTQAQEQASDPLPHAGAIAAVIEIRPGASEHPPYVSQPPKKSFAQRNLDEAAARRRRAVAEYRAAQEAQ